MKHLLKKSGRSSSPRLHQEEELLKKHKIIKKYAHALVNAFMNLGIITNPHKCCLCQNTNNVIAHHDNYFKAFDLMWLCRSCHEFRHVKLRSLGCDPCDIFCQKILESPLGESYLNRLRQFYSQVAALSTELFDESFFDPSHEFPKNVKLSLVLSDEVSQSSTNMDQVLCKE